MSTDWTAILAGAAALVALANTAYAWLTAGSKANTGRLAEVESQLSRLADRTIVIEREIAHMPAAQAVHDLEVTMERMSGNLKQTSEKLDGINGWLTRLDRVTERIEQFLLDQGGRK